MKSAKEEQVSDWTSENLTSEQLEYAALDADVLVDLYGILKPKLIDAGLAKIAGIEFKAIPAVGEIELNGMKLDLDKWGEWVKGLEAEYKEVGDRLKKQLKSGDAQLSLLPEYDTIDLDSHAQVLKSLKSLGIPISDTNFKTIAPLTNDYPVIADLLEYRRVSKALTSFGYALPKSDVESPCLFKQGMKTSEPFRSDGFNHPETWYNCLKLSRSRCTVVNKF